MNAFLLLSYQYYKMVSKIDCIKRYTREINSDYKHIPTVMVLLLDFIIHMRKVEIIKRIAHFNALFQINNLKYRKECIQ